MTMTARPDDKEWLSMSSRETIRLARSAARNLHDLRRIDDTEERLRRNGFIIRQLSEKQFRDLLRQWRAAP